MVNAKRAIPQLVGAIRKRIAECQNYATDRQTTPWSPFVESGAKEILEVLNEKRRNLETRWQDEFEAQLSNEDWEKFSVDVEKVVDDVNKAQSDLRKWIESKHGENVPNPGAAQVQGSGQVKESAARIVESFKRVHLFKRDSLFVSWNFRQDF